MALIIITLQDTDDNGIDVRLNSEPLIVSGDNNYTMAQKLGAVALNAITESLNNQPRLVIAGADELPN